MITYQHLLDADFSGIRTAADVWAGVPKELSGAGGVRQEFDTVCKGLSDGTWTGDAADAARPVMRSLATQISRAGDEAHDIAKLLDDAHREFTAAQSSLRTIVDDVTSAHSAFAIDASGTVTVKPGGDPRLAQSAQQTADGYNASVRQLLQDATETDRALRWALRDDTDGAKDQGFSEAEFSSVSGAEAARAASLRDARTAVGLAKKVPLTRDDARELNALLADHTGDPDFGAAFATGLGPDGTLSLWASASNTLGEDLIGRGTLKTLQSDLGLTLASATHDHTPAMETWQQRMVAAATRPVPSQPDLLGCQVMSNLMRTGSYDQGFLASYGHTVMALDAGRKRWDADPDTSRLNYLGGSPYDPLEGYMDALDHNPGYATTFLNHKGYFDQLADRRWYDSQTALGHALAAGATGHPFGTPPDGAMPWHTSAQAAVMHTVAEHYGAGDLSALPSGLAPGLGRLTAEYMPDINTALSPGNPHNDPNNRPDGLAQIDFPPNTPPGHSADLDTNAATRLLFRLGKSPSGYAPIALAQTRYTTGLIAYHALDPNAVDPTMTMRIDHVVKAGAAVTTVLNEGASQSTVDTAAARDAAYNQSLTHEGDWVKAGVGIGANLSEGVPVVGKLLSKTIETVGGHATDGLLTPYQHDTTGDASNTAGREFFRNTGVFSDTIKNAAIQDGVPAKAHMGEHTFASDFDDSFQSGVANGNSALRGTSKKQP